MKSHGKNPNKYANTQNETHTTPKLKPSQNVIEILIDRLQNISRLEGNIILGGESKNDESYAPNKRNKQRYKVLNLWIGKHI